jgi:DNA-binding NarL/FixJ family response regulator
MHSGEPRSIELFVLDDHAIVRRGIAQLAAEVPWIAGCRSAASLEEALAELAIVGADVAVVDLSLHGASGMVAIDTLLERFPSMRIVVFSLYGDPVHCTRAFERGAHAFVSKNDSNEELIEAIASVAKGGTYIGQSVQRLVASGVARPHDQTPDALAMTLTPREREILKLIGQGLASAEVAFELERSVKTVEAHKANMREKLGLRTNQQLLQFAAKWMQFGAPEV